MKKLSYLNELAKLLTVKVEALTDEFFLKNTQLWDSLSIISTVALIDNHYNVATSGVEIEQCNTVGDIFILIKQKLLEKYELAAA